MRDACTSGAVRLYYRDCGVLGLVFFLNRSWRSYFALREDALTSLGLQAQGD